MKLYFVRHGESEANLRHIISNRDVPLALTALGRAQARALAETLRDVPIDAIFCSPVFRARETAGILSEFFNVAYQVTEALREYDCGVLEDKSDEESWRLHREFYEDWTRRHKYERKPEGGESFLDIRKRFLPFLETLIQHSSRKEEQILLIGHGGLFHLMLPRVLVNIEDEFVNSHGLGHTTYVVAELVAGELICRQWREVQL